MIDVTFRLQIGVWAMLAKDGVKNISSELSNILLSTSYHVSVAIHFVETFLANKTIMDTASMLLML